MCWRLMWFSKGAAKGSADTGLAPLGKIATIDSNKYMYIYIYVYGHGTIYAGVPSSKRLQGWRTVMFQISGFDCSGGFGTGSERVQTSDKL